VFAEKNPSPLLARYDALVAEKAIERDDGQLAALAALDRLLGEIERPPRRAGLLSFLRRGRQTRGVYLWGGVGRGKTTLMDLFFDAARGAAKRRVHFHGFMFEVHARLHLARKESNGGTDPIERVVQELAEEARLLCFDEFSVSDIADATILARLFSALLAAGVVVVATSNYEPRRLYEGGRNRDLFLPFIDLLEERLEVVRLDSGADFRMGKRGCAEIYVVARSAEEKALARERLGDGPFAAAALKVNGRILDVPRARGALARFEFSELCGRPLGAADYLALAKVYDVIVVDDVPRLSPERRNEARRLITLVDVLYEAKAKLRISAEAEPAELYRAENGAEAREFSRTVSRLTEMRSQAYLDEWAARRDELEKIRS
jgi:cell division protein ZapE